MLQVIKGQAVFRRRKLEERVRCDDPQVTLHRQLQARADGGPVDGADHRYRSRVHHPVQLDEPVRVVGGERIPAQVRPGAEHRALSGQHDDPGLPAAGFEDGLPQLVHELGIQGVAALGTLQLNRHDRFGLGDTDHGRQDI